MDKRQSKSKYQKGIFLTTCGVHPEYENDKFIEVLQGTFIIILKDLPNRHHIQIYDEQDNMYHKSIFVCDAANIRKLDEIIFMYTLAIPRNDRIAFLNDQLFIKYILSLNKNDKIRLKNKPNEWVVMKNKFMGKDGIGFYFQISRVI